MYQLQFNYPNLPKGAEIDITGLDYIFKNGETYDVTTAEADRFRSVQAEMLGLETGPTLSEAFKDNGGVKVTVKKKEGDN